MISVVIPAYNEAERLPSTLKAAVSFLGARHSAGEYEILIVSDGSTDQTEEIVRSFSSQNPRLKLLVNKKNAGKGFSVCKGVLNSSGDPVLFMDADGSTPLIELDKFIKYLKDYAIVIGSRALPGSKIAKRQFWLREYTGKFLNFVIQLFFLPGIKDTQCGFKLFKRKAALEIFRRAKINRFIFDVEILCLAKKLGYKILELPVTWTNSKPSKVSFCKDSLNILFDLGRIKLGNL